MTVCELAQMVKIMRRDQMIARDHLTQAARSKAEYDERVVDKAVKQVLEDEETEGIVAFDKVIPAP